MQNYSNPEEMRKALSAFRDSGKIVLVPTMGALHDGHEALLNRARCIAGDKGCVVASIFVNPIQFDNADDLSSYPRRLEDDLARCERAGVDYVFSPDVADMYHSDMSVRVDECSLSERLCGASRPGHFSGVCTVVLKLLNIVGPTDAVFGKKDYQQLAIIRRMVRDLNVPVTIHGAETVREKDGLALSSRNVRLTAENRTNAVVMRRALLEASDLFEKGIPVEQLIVRVKELIGSQPYVKIDYVDVVDTETLKPYEKKPDNGPALMAVAVFFGDVRLIDNIEL